MVSLLKRPLTFVKTAGIPLPERPNHPILISEDHEEEADRFSWAEASVDEVEADSAEEALVEAASEAVELAADFKSITEN